MQEDAGRSEIVPFIEYIAGRSSGKYTASHPPWYRGNGCLRYRDINNITTLDNYALSTAIKDYEKTFPAFKLLELNTNSTLAGNSAYTLIGRSFSRLAKTNGYRNDNWR